MEKLERFAKWTPSLVIVSIVVSSLYNVGFFLALAHPSLITQLTYQDILTSSIFALAALLTASIFVVNIFEFYKAFSNPSISGRLLLSAAILFVVALTILYLDIFDYFGWILLLLSLTGLVSRLATKLLRTVPSSFIPAIATFLATGITAFCMGYDSYRTESCLGNTYITYKECEGCKLIRAYSNVFIVKKVDEKINFLSTPSNITIYHDDTERLSNISTKQCNPIGFWMAEKTGIPELAGGN